eukprot:3407917-Pleurochrysis_carterae.AAC.1
MFEDAQRVVEGCPHSARRIANGCGQRTIEKNVAPRPRNVPVLMDATEKEVRLPSRLSCYFIVKCLSRPHRRASGQ